LGFAFAEATGLFAHTLALFLLLIIYYKKIDAMVKKKNFFFICLL
jgi:hypothetical protein